MSEQDWMDVASSFAKQADAENQSPSTSPIPMPDGGGADEDPIDFVINRVRLVIHESAQMGTEPLSTIASVLAQLYQAKALRDIAEQMREGIDMTFESSRFHRSKRLQRRRNPRIPGKSFADIFRDLADAYEDSEAR